MERYLALGAKHNLNRNSGGCDGAAANLPTTAVRFLPCEEGWGAQGGTCILRIRRQRYGTLALSGAFSLSCLAVGYFQMWWPIKIFLVLGVLLVGQSTWAFIDARPGWQTDPKIVISFITWGIYMALVFLRTVAGWRGRKAAIMTVTVSGFAALTWAAHARLGDLLFKS